MSHEAPYNGRDDVQWVEAMKRHGRLRARAWMLMAGVVILVAGHGVILYYVSSHVALSAAVVSGVIILVVIKHLGLLGPVSALFRRRARRKPML
jgi:membrane protein YdbS with pleckstrin-like domain